MEGDIQMYKIMIIEDDEAMAHTMKKQIESWGNEVLCADDFQNIIPAFVTFDPHMVLVDLMLPFYNGYYWCTQIRKISNVPVIFLSSASDNMNIVMAMNMGGDDFIPKPVDLNVLTAKLQAALRRAYDMGGKIPVLEHRGAVLNLNDASLSYLGARIELTKNEFRILQLLLENKKKVVSRDTLMTKLWQMDSYVEENTLTVNVTRLRKKLEKAGLKDFILTKVGSGYIIE
jgi:Response regulators consisting of a CheY-like receiver domain and a winged-helix DNA-binding domain